MIPDRAPAPRTHDLTMLRYQQMPMIPQRPSNADQRRLVAATQNKSPAQSIPKKIGRPRIHPVKAKVKCKDPRAQAAATLSANHAKRIAKQVAEMFKHGPLTVDMIMRQLKYTVRQAASRKVMDWKARGLIVEVDCKPTGNGNNQRAKWWGLKSTNEHTD